MSPFISGLRTFDRLLGRIASVVSAISGFCLVLLVACFGWLVFGRYVLNATPTWVEQVALLLIVVISLFSTAGNTREGANLSVEVVPLMLSWRWRRWLLALNDFILAGFGLLMAIAGYDLTVFAWSTKVPMIDAPEGLRTLPLVVCGVLLVLFSAVNAAKRFTEGEPSPPPDIESPLRGLE